MRSPTTFLVLVAALSAQHPASGQEKPEQTKEAAAKSQVVSVGLFKNGLAVVKREILVPGPGTYRLETAAEPVHGTFWVESNCRVETAVKMREIERPLHTSPLVNLQEELGGKKVTIHFKNDKLPAMSGTLLKIEARPATEPPLLEKDWYSARERFYIVQTPKGRMYINPSEIAMVLAEEAAEKITQRRPVLVLTVGKEEKKPSIFVTYLAHGLAWAPSYLVDVSDPKTLSIEMATVVRNEMDDVEGAEFRLISGYPSVEFANVLSPLAARAKWETFFREVEQRNQGARQDALFQQRAVVSNTHVPDQPRFKLGAIPAGEGVDLHFESIGKRSLLKGEALSLTVGKAKGDYERIVEWTVGTSPVSKHYGTTSITADEMWDVLYFKNPFSFPMTTAPAMIVEKGQFNGQRTSFWANVGEEARLRVTRSLSVRAASSEQEEGRANESVVVDGKTYAKVFLQGELVMNNHRKEPVKMHITHSIRGQIQEIEGDPRITVVESSLQDINRVYQPRWTVTLRPGEEKRLSYKHCVLVYR